MDNKKNQKPGTGKSLFSWWNFLDDQWKNIFLEEAERKFNQPIKDPTDTVLQFIKNLTELNLSQNQITDLAPLEGLKNLYILELFNNESITNQISVFYTKLPDCRIKY